MCIEYHIQVNMYHVSAQGVDERTITVHYYYYIMCCYITKNILFEPRAEARDVRISPKILYHASSHAGLQVTTSFTQTAVGHNNNNITVLLNVNTLIARGLFCSAKYTHHTFTPIIKHLITTTANKHPGKKSFIDKNMKNPTGIKLCISHKMATSRGPPS